MKPRKEGLPKRNTRALARRLFPTWSRRQLARWVVAKLRSEGGTYRFPVGAKHFEHEIPRFLRTLPLGPPLDIHESARDKRIKSTRFIGRLVGGRK